MRIFEGITILSKRATWVYPTILRKIKKARGVLSTIPNYCYRSVRKSLGYDNHNRLFYVVPGANWVTDWVGHYVVKGVSESFGINASITSTPHLLIDHILHFGEAGAFLASVETRYVRNNKNIATIFHGTRSEKFPCLRQFTERFLENTSKLARVVTACKIMENRLLDWGVPTEKVVRLPLGVDTKSFFPVSLNEKLRFRQQLNIPLDAFCIGSFQKDGEGWEEGLSPKLIKGPDIFLEVIDRLHKQNDKVFVLLTAPARGFVKYGLQRIGVPYKHVILQDFKSIPKMYHCLDAYLITSREEGGPQALLEAMACGVPVVSTRVGMAPDVIKHEENGLIAEIEDVDEMVGLLLSLVEDKEVCRYLIKNALVDIQFYDWNNISKLYYRNLYEPILATFSSSG